MTVAGLMQAPKNSTDNEPQLSFKRELRPIVFSSEGYKAKSSSGQVCYLCVIEHKLFTQNLLLLCLHHNDKFGMHFLGFHQLQD